MKTILLTNHYSKAPFDIVRSVLPTNFKLIMLEENSQMEVERLAKEADYILASGRVRITKEVLNKATKLKMIQRTGVGLDSLDLDELRKRRIPLYVNQGINSQSVAEHTLLLILSCLRKLTIIHNNTINGIWKKQEQGVQTFELAGKTVGLIGMGNIAQKVVKLLTPFGVSILYYDINRLSSERESLLGVRYCTIDELLSRADIISLHCPLTESTRKLINTERISFMKDGCILVNTARGELIDTKAIIDALNSDKIAFAGLDVHEEEPIKDDNPIKSLRNVILTPHIGGITYDSFVDMMQGAMKNICLYDQGKYEEIASALYKF